MQKTKRKYTFLSNNIVNNGRYRKSEFIITLNQKENVFLEEINILFTSRWKPNIT